MKKYPNVQKATMTAVTATHRSSLTRMYSSQDSYSQNATDTQNTAVKIGVNITTVRIVPGGM
jgi:hypothetical protein